MTQWNPMPSENNQYRELPSAEAADVTQMLSTGDYRGAAVALVGYALSTDRPGQAWELMLQCSEHADDQIRGNAILCMGHLARRFGNATTEGPIDPERVVPIIERGLQDNSDWVSGHAWDTASDVLVYCGWQVNGYADAEPTYDLAEDEDDDEDA
jgi:hypothetical protein